MSSPLISQLWPYRFIALTPGQIQERREILDLRGYYVQLSALCLLLGAGIIYRVVTPTATSTETGDKQISRRRCVATPTPGSAGRLWLDLPPVEGWSETRREYLIILMWLGWLVFLSVYKTGHGMYLFKIFSFLLGLL